MSAERKNKLSEVMTLAWQFVKRNGLNMAEALKRAWANIKLKGFMKMGIIKFWFAKVDGTIREAYGTLANYLTPQTNVTSRKKNDTLQVYYDAEKCEWRSFKKANLIKYSLSY